MLHFAFTAQDTSPQLLTSPDVQSAQYCTKLRLHSLFGHTVHVVLSSSPYSLQLCGLLHYRLLCMTDSKMADPTWHDPEAAWDMSEASWLHQIIAVTSDCLSAVMTISI